MEEGRGREGGIYLDLGLGSRLGINCGGLSRAPAGAGETGFTHTPIPTYNTGVLLRVWPSHHTNSMYNVIPRRSARSFLTTV